MQNTPGISHVVGEERRQPLGRGLRASAAAAQLRTHNNELLPRKRRLNSLGVLAVSSSGHVQGGVVLSALRHLRDDPLQTSRTAGANVASGIRSPRRQRSLAQPLHIDVCSGTAGRRTFTSAMTPDAPSALVCPQLTESAACCVP